MGVQEKVSPVPRRLREAREERGISQRDLGIRAGIDEFAASPRINQYERGKHAPDFVTLTNIANVLEVPVAFFFAEDDGLASVIRLYARAEPAARRAAFLTLKPA